VPAASVTVVRAPDNPVKNDRQMIIGSAVAHVADLVVSSQIAEPV
jgi:hypothetical protein